MGAYPSHNDVLVRVRARVRHLAAARLVVEVATAVDLPMVVALVDAASRYREGVAATATTMA